MAELNPASHPSGLDERRLVVASLLVATVAVIVYLSTRPKAPTVPTTTHKQTSALATPEAFNDFIGTIQSINADTWRVRFVSTDIQGKDHAMLYTIVINQQTTLTSLSTVDGTTTSLQADQFHVGDTVHVVADHDIANTDSFTATSINSFIHS